MLFNSIDFLLFFPVVAIGYFIVPFRARWLLLLAASYYFYASWNPAYLLLIIGSTLVDYIVALQIGSTPAGKKRRALLFISLGTNLGLLFVFKYFNFFIESFAAMMASASIPVSMPILNVLLPVGISFYTFQTLGYTIDVYRGDKQPERHLGIFALYVSYFPQLVAGPIEKSTHLLPQFHNQYNFDYERITNGLKLVAWGFFKKIVIADRLARLVDTVYSNPGAYDGPQLLLATYFFAFQIYCDFSGYSDIAIGASQIMGYDLMENFRRPYFAASIGDFWKRWHISLSGWFRDYLYISLGGKRVSKAFWYRNIAIVFLVSGLWHGANWTFVVWGALHACYLIFGAALAPTRAALIKLLGLGRFPVLLRVAAITTTFHLALLGWVFFRAATVSDAIYIVTHIPQNFGPALSELIGTIAGTAKSKVDMGLSGRDLIVCFGVIAMMEAVHLVQELRRISIRWWVAQWPFPLRWALYYFGLATLLFLGTFEKAQFLYFQF